MSSDAQNHRGLLVAVLLAACAFFCSTDTLSVAQEGPAPKWEFFGGYSFFYPGADIHGQLPDGILPVSSRLESNPRGAGASLTYNFNRWFGLTLDSSGHWGSGESGIIDRIDDTAFYNLSFGPKVTFRSHYVSPFLEVLVGDHRLAPDAFYRIDKLGFMGGGGLDINLSRHVALRLIRADYVFSNYRYGPSATTERTEIRGARLQSGIVFMWGGGEPAAPVSASCSLRPSEVMAGEPVYATVTPSNFNPRHTLTYSWHSTGGTVSGKDASATIDTNGARGGNYTVTASVSDPKMRQNGEATCNSTFNVKQPPKYPPTMSCSANPATVQAGNDSNISCTCSSQDSQPVTVSGWSASGGNLSGSGENATLSTTGAPAGPITVSATCTDARGLTAPASTQVMVEAQPLRPPQSSKLSQCDFPNPKKPWRVDNTCKAILDDVAKNLQQNPDNRLVIVGNADAGETRRNLAAERAVNSKAYLSSGESQLGIDTSRIEVRTGSAGTMTAEYWVVPSGASFRGEGTQPVDETQIKAVPDHPRMR